MTPQGVLLAGLLALWGNPTASGILIPGEMLEILTLEVSFAEGPAAGHDNAIYFSDIPAGSKPGRILRYDPETGGLTEFRMDSGKSNGIFVDAQGRLVVCEGADYGGRRIARYDGPGSAETLTDRFEGKRYNAPNDVTIDPLGRIWFSDPKYVGEEPRELEHRGVYRIDRDCSVHRVLGQPTIDKPNGVAVSPDGSTLYVTDTCDHPIPLEGGSGERPGNQHLLAFAILPNGELGPKRILVDFAPQDGGDGLTVDTSGNLYVACRRKDRPGIGIFSPEGTELGWIATPALPTNCIFGRGAESQRLYITMDTGLARIRTAATGYHLPKP